MSNLRNRSDLFHKRNTILRIPYLIYLNSTPIPTNSKKLTMETSSTSSQSKTAERKALRKESTTNFSTHALISKNSRLWSTCLEQITTDLSFILPASIRYMALRVTIKVIQRTVKLKP
jgi:hypothetical protein